MKCTLLLLIMHIVFTNAIAQAYKNPKLSTSQRITDLLSKMTLEEKVTQLLLNINRRPPHDRIKKINTSKGFRNLSTKNSTVTFSPYGHPFFTNFHYGQLVNMTRK